MTRYQRSSQIWSLLICAAKDKKTYTYGEIAKVLGFGGAGVMAPLLGCIMWFCEEKNLPPLTVLSRWMKIKPYSPLSVFSIKCYY